MDRLRWASLILIALVVTTGATCNRNNKVEPDPAASASSSAAPAKKIELEGIDTSKLTPREHGLWSTQVSELLAPCPEVAVPVAQCVREKRDCKACGPAAEFLVKMVRAGLGKKELAELYAMRFDPKKVKTIVLGDSPRKGAEDPPVTIVEFADFECPACGQVYPVLEELYAKRGKQMQVVFKHNPLPQHPNAKLASQAAWAAQQQKQFWKMFKMLFEHQERLTEPDLVSYAEQIGLDVARFKKDMHSEEAKKAVEQDLAQGESLGVSFTPTIYINGRELDLSKLPNFVQDLDDWVALEIELAGGDPSPEATGDDGDEGDGGADTAEEGSGEETGAAPAPSAN